MRYLHIDLIILNQARIFGKKGNRGRSAFQDIIFVKLMSSKILYKFRYSFKYIKLIDLLKEFS